MTDPVCIFLSHPFCSVFLFSWEVKAEGEEEVEEISDGVWIKGGVGGGEGGKGGYKMVM